MSKKSALPGEDWALFRLALMRNHLQELKDTLAAQTQSQQSLSARHRCEMAQISALPYPLGWAMAIYRYNRQFIDLQSTNKFTQRLIKRRQEQERADLEKWITQFQRNEDTEVLFFDQLTDLFEWSLTKRQRQYYRRTLRGNSTLVLTDLNKSILWASQRFLAMTGYRPFDVFGKTPAFLQGPDTDPNTLDFIRKRLSRAQACATELINYRKNGERYLCCLKINPLFNRQGELTHFLAVEYEVYDQEGN